MGTLIRVGIIGFGVAGEFFHGAFLAADPNYEIVGVVTRDTERVARVRDIGARPVASLEELLELSPDLVVVASPPKVHAEHAIAALQHGCHVVVDKPFAPSVLEAESICRAAERAGRSVTVYQNRRFDRDFVTVRRLLTEGLVGEPHTFESRFEWWKPQVDESWKSATSVEEGGGLLLDLGPHLVDQAITLFGPVARVRHADLRTLRAGAVAEDDVFIELEHDRGVLSRLTMSSLAASMGDRFRLSGDDGCLVVRGLDEQEHALRSTGASPSDPGFRRDSRSVTVGPSEQQIPLDEGSYGDFYRQLAAHLREGATPPVDIAEALEVMRVLEAVRAAAS